MQGQRQALAGLLLISIARPTVGGPHRPAQSQLTEGDVLLDRVSSFFVSAILISTIVVNVRQRENADKHLAAWPAISSRGTACILTHPGLSLVLLAMAVAMFVISPSPHSSHLRPRQLHAARSSSGPVSAMVASACSSDDGLSACAAARQSST